MDNGEKLLKLIEKLAEKTMKDKTDRESVLKEFKDKEKIKALTTDERLKRIEKLLGI